MNQPNIAPQTGGEFSNARIAYIEAGWHNDIVSQARVAFSKKVAEYGIDKIDVWDVPGSLEIPLQAKMLLKNNQYDIVVACGLIVNGGIYRHDFVASTVLDAMMQVSLESEVPLLSVVLTPIHFHEHEDHHGFFKDHFLKKGGEAADACIKMLSNVRRLKQSVPS